MAVLRAFGVIGSLLAHLTMHFIRTRTRLNPFVSKYLFSSFYAIPTLTTILGACQLGKSKIYYPKHTGLAFAKLHFE